MVLRSAVHVWPRLALLLVALLGLGFGGGGGRVAAHISTASLLSCCSRDPLLPFASSSIPWSELGRSLDDYAARCETDKLWSDLSALTDITGATTDRFETSCCRRSVRFLRKRFGRRMGECRQQQAKKERRALSSHSVAGSGKTEEHPEPIDDRLLGWMGTEQKQRLSEMTRWDAVHKIGELYFAVREENRQPYETGMRAYCMRNLNVTLGNDRFEVIRKLYEDSATVEHLWAKFQELSGQLRDERLRAAAEYYALFCKRVLRLVRYDPGDLTSWLDPRQKQRLASMIRNPAVTDAKVYAKVVEFFREADAEQKREAQTAVQSSCIHFLTKMFGEQTAEDFEERRSQGVVPKQVLAAELVELVRQIRWPSTRSKAEQALPICVGIYVDHSVSSCECGGHADECSETDYACVDCRHGTEGVQCEKCADGFTGDARSIEGCRAVPTESHEDSVAENVENGVENQSPVGAHVLGHHTATHHHHHHHCACHNHANECDGSACLNCAHNTTGEHCELCARGFYGLAETGRPDDCNACPCPDNGECFINDVGLVECRVCPSGKSGLTCQDDEEVDQETRSNGVAAA